MTDRDYKIWRQHRHGNDPLQGYASNFEGAQIAHMQEAPDGARTVSSGMLNKTTSDPGGISYGSFQFTSQYIDDKGKHHDGTDQDFMRSDEFKPFLGNFKDKNGHLMKVNSEEFKDAWRNIKNPMDFEKAQFEFAMKRYHEPQVAELNRHGINADDRGSAFNNAITSTSIQHGQNLGGTIVLEGMESEAKKLGKPIAALTDREAIIGIYAERDRRNNNTPGRYEHELEIELELLNREQGLRAPSAARLDGPEHQVQPHHTHVNHGHADHLDEVIGDAIKDRGTELNTPQSFIDPSMASKMPGLNSSMPTAANTAAPATSGTLDPATAGAMPNISSPLDVLAGPLSVVQNALGGNVTGETTKTLHTGAEPMTSALNRHEKSPVKKQNTTGDSVYDQMPGLIPR